MSLLRQALQFLAAADIFDTDDLIIPRDNPCGKLRVVGIHIDVSHTAVLIQKPEEDPVHVQGTCIQPVTEGCFYSKVICPHPVLDYGVSGKNGCRTAEGTDA